MNSPKRIFLIISTCLTLVTIVNLLFSKFISATSPLTPSLRQASSTITATPFPLLTEMLDQAPFPRTYFMYHAAGSCITNLQVIQEIMRYGNIVELHFRQGLSKNVSHADSRSDDFKDFNPTLLDLGGTPGSCYNSLSTRS